MKIIKEIEIITINNTVSIIVNLLNGMVVEIPQEYIEHLTDRNYIFENDTQYDEYIINMENKINQSTKIQPPNFIYVPNYDCNLKCYYCFEVAFNKEFDDRSIDSDANILFASIENTINILQKQFEIVYKPNEIRLDITGG